VRPVTPDALHLPVEVVADELEAMTPGLSDEARTTFRRVLADTIAQDAYTCTPSPRAVFGDDAPEGERLIDGAMPHYGFFFGPMHYLVRRIAARAGAPGRWEIEARYAVDLPREGGTLELSDCASRASFEGHVVCRGVPYADSNTTDACPKSGVFQAEATPRNMRALLARWSSEAEGYWSRDAARFGLAVRYDFDFVPRADAEGSGMRVDITLPLSRTCGRTPYFWALRSGWSLPILAHEVGHLLGLLDEYEALSGIFPFYPKTPFPGAQTSRMGLSMKESSVLYPLHHYLVLRRYLCAEPSGRDPYVHAVQ
jgi:hypothetical protein